MLGFKLPLKEEVERRVLTRDFAGAEHAFKQARAGLMFAAQISETTDKPTLYEDLTEQLGGLLDGETDFIANAANMAALIFNGPAQPELGRLLSD
ncbi:MAG: hypothetical protein WDN69_23325 [Aliidongia sp.]